MGRCLKRSAGNAVICFKGLKQTLYQDEKAAINTIKVFLEANLFKAKN
jgi:hypothetical protein